MRQGNVFTGVWDSVHRGGVCLSACWDTHPPGRYIPLGRYPPSRYTPSAQAGTPCRQVHPPGRHTPRQVHPRRQLHPHHDGHCSRRYASYWNAYLYFIILFDKKWSSNLCIHFDGIPRNRFCQINGKKITVPSSVFISTYVFFIKSLVFSRHLLG